MHITGQEERSYKADQENKSIFLTKEMSSKLLRIGGIIFLITFALKIISFLLLGFGMETLPPLGFTLIAVGGLVKVALLETVLLSAIAALIMILKHKELTSPQVALIIILIIVIAMIFIMGENFFRLFSTMHVETTPNPLPMPIETFNTMPTF